MKKNKNNNSAKHKSVKVAEEKDSDNTEQAVQTESLDDEEQGFGGWLR